MSASYPQPPGGRLQLVEASDDRLVVVIPAGGKRVGGLGCFALLWNAICIPAGIAMLTADDESWDGGEAPPFWGLVLFFSVFWSVGIGVLVAWVRMKFTRVLLSVEPEMLSVQRTLFGRKKLTQTSLGPNSSADLKTAFTQNDEPVYKVQIEGRDRNESFGTSLSYDEKRWIVKTVNRFLGNESDHEQNRSVLEHREYCDECGTRLLSGDDKRVCPDCGKVFLREDEDGEDRPVKSKRKRDDLTAVPAAGPDSLSPDTRIRLEVDQADQIKFSYRAVISTKARLIIGGFLGGFVLIWYGALFGLVGDAFFGDDGFELGVALVVGIVMGTAGFVPMGFLVALFVGRISITLDRAQLSGRIHAGPFGWGHSIATDSITSVGIGDSFSDHDGGRTRSGGRGQRVCKVCSTEHDMPLTISSDVQLNTEIASLVLYQLERMGFQLAAAD